VLLSHKAFRERRVDKVVQRWGMQSNSEMMLIGGCHDHSEFKTVIFGLRVGL
jgi:hypothetical protein